MLEYAPGPGLGERLLALRESPLLASLPAAELSLLARLSRDRDLPAGAALAVEDQPVRVLQLLVSGRVTLSRAGALAGSSGPFDVVGLTAIAAGLPHPFTARAVEPVHVIEIDAGLVADVLEDDFLLFVAVLRLAARAALDRRGGRGVVGGHGDGDARAAAARPAADLDAADRLMTLRQAPLFHASPVDGLAALARRLAVARVPAGHLLVQPGLRSAAEVAVLIDGRAEDAGPGAVLGVLEGLAGAPLPSARALSPVRALRGTVTDLLDVLDDHHMMGRRLMAELVGLAMAP